jgi:hypothetical protein
MRTKPTTDVAASAAARKNHPSNNPRTARLAIVQIILRPFNDVQLRSCQDGGSGITSGEYQRCLRFSDGDRKTLHREAKTFDGRRAPHWMVRLRPLCEFTIVRSLPTVSKQGTRPAALGWLN